MTLLSSLLLSLILTIVLTPLFNHMAMRLNLYDVPDARKIHTRPVPRIGGLAIAIGAFASIVLWAPLGDMLRAYLLGASILVVVGLVDDWKGLDFKVKFIGQLVAALIYLMPRISRAIAVGYPHHITQRGNYRQEVFADANDYNHYLRWLAQSAEKCGLEIWAYCLMPNHLVGVPRQADSLSRTFHTVHMKYARYFNSKRNAVGHLWE